MKQRCEDCRIQNRTGLCRLKESDWASFINTRSLHEFRTRQVVFREGMPASIVYVLCHGQVKLSLTTMQGTTRILKLCSADMHPCDILDKAALGTSVHSLTCETLTDAQIACIERTRFMWLMEHHHQFALLVAHTLIAEANSSIGAFRQKSASARQRTARLLLALAESGANSPNNGKNGAHTLRLRRSEMAELLGTARETAIRLLGTFHREGLIALKGQRIDIVMPDRLRRIAGIQPARMTMITLET